MKCIIVEDELPAVKVIQNHLAHFSDLELVGTYHKAMDAFVEIQKNDGIDLIFLDIQLPQMSGIQLLETLGKFPSVILTTAYREFAMDGYDLEITDYLLKPISLERFAKAIAKVYKQHSKPHTISDFLATHTPSIFSDPFIYVKVDRENIKIKLKDIYYIESKKNHIKISTSTGAIITMASLSQIEERLPKQYFQRIHRSYIVGLEHIVGFTQSYVTIMNKAIPIGSFYKQSFSNSIQEYLL